MLVAQGDEFAARGAAALVRLATVVTVAVFVAAWSVLLAPLAQGQGSAEARTAIIMDASSSMLEPDEGGTRLDVAKRATTQLIDSLPETAQVGMLAYGAQESDAPDNHERGCRDIRTLAPVAQVDKATLKADVDALEAKGYTPIGNALRKAAEELGPEGQRSIVLVSDGIDTCAPPDPCEVAKELAGDGIGLAVHVVGFKVDEAARAQLECIAEETGGEYRQADDAAALTESLDFLAQRAMNPYEAFGTPFRFADTAEDGKYLGEGLYQSRIAVDDAPNGGTVDDAPEHFFKVAVPDGHAARIVATPLPNIDLDSESGGQGVDTQLATHYLGSDCNPDEDSEFEIIFGGGFDSAASVQVTIDSTTSSNEKCDNTQWAVGMKTVSDSHREAIAVEVSVQFEPVVTDTSGFPEGDTGEIRSNDSIPSLPITGPKPIVGGNSYNNAAHLEPGAYSDAIVPGETRYYAFDVDWGQTPHLTAATGASVIDAVDQIRFEMFNPLRARIAETKLHFYSDERTEGTAMPDRAVNYLNREANVGGRSHANAGTHYLAVTMDVPSDDKTPRGVEQPFEFVLAVEGEPAEGPDWRPSTEPGPPPSDTPPGTEGAGTEDTSAETAAPSAGSQSGQTDALAAQESADDDRPAWLIPAAVGGGAVVLLGLAGIAVAALRRK